MVVGACKWRHLCAPPDWSIISLSFSQKLFWPQGVRQSFVVEFDTTALFFSSNFFSHITPIGQHTTLTGERILFQGVFILFLTHLEQLRGEEAVKDGREMRKFYHPGRGVMTTYRTQQDAAFGVTKFLENGRPILTIEKQKERERSLLLKIKGYFFTHISKLVGTPSLLDSGS